MIRRNLLRLGFLPVLAAFVNAGVVFAQDSNLVREGSSAEAYYQEGERLYQQGKYKEATALFQKALGLMEGVPEQSGAVAPSSASGRTPTDSLMAQGKSLYRKRRFQEASRSFERILQLDPANETAANWLVRAREGQAYQEAGSPLSDDALSGAVTSESFLQSMEIDATEELRAASDAVRGASVSGFSVSDERENLMLLERESLEKQSRLNLVIRGLQNERVTLEQRIAKLEIDLKTAESDNRQLEAALEEQRKLSRTLTSSNEPHNRRLSELLDRIQRLEDQLADASRELTTKARQIDVLENRISGRTDELKKQDARFTDVLAKMGAYEERAALAESKVAELSQKLSAAESIRGQLTQELEHVRKVNSALGRTKERQDAQTNQFEQELARSKDNVDALKKKIDDLETTNRQLKRNLELAHNSPTEKRLQKELSIAQDKLARLENDHRQLLTEQSHLQEVQEQLIQVREDQQKRIDQLTAQLQSRDESNQSLSNSRIDLTQQLNDLQKQLELQQNMQVMAEEDWRRKNTELSAALNERDTRIDTLTAELAMLRQGQSQGEKDLAVLRDRLSARERLISDLQEKIVLIEEDADQRAANLVEARRQQAIFRERLEERNAQIESRDQQVLLMRERIDSLQQEQSSASTEVKQLRSALNSKEEELARLRKVLEEDQIALDRFGKDYADISKERNLLSDKLATLTQAKAQLESQYEGLRLTTEKLYDQIETLNGEVGRRQSEYVESQKTLAQSEQQLIETQQELSGLKEKQQSVMSQYEALLKNTERTQAELELKTAALQEANNQNKYLQDALQQSTAEKDRYLADLQEAQTSYASSQETVQEYGRKIASAEHAVRQLKGELDHVRQLNAQLNKSKEQQDTRLEQLFSETEALQGDKETLLFKNEELQDLNTTLERRMSRMTEEFSAAQKRWAGELESASNMKSMRESEAAEAKARLKEALADVNDMQRQLTAVTERLSQRQEALEKKEAQVIALQNELRTAEQEKFNATNEAQKIRQLVQDKDKELERLSGLLAQREVKLDELRAERDKYSTRSVELSNQLQSVEHENIRLQTEVGSFKQANKSLEEKMRAQQAEFAQTQSRWSEELERLSLQLTQKESELSTTSSQLEQTQTKLANVHEQRTILEHRVKQMSAELAESNTNLLNKDREVKLLSSNLDEAKEQLAIMSNQLTERSLTLSQRDEQLVELQGYVKGLERTQTTAVTESKQLEARLQSSEAEIQRLRNSLVGEQQTAKRLAKDRSDQQIKINHLEEQLRIAKDTQGNLHEELKSVKHQLADLQDKSLNLQSERDRYRSNVDQRETSIGQLQAELDSVRRDLTSAQAQLKQAQLSVQEKEQQLIVDREGTKWQVDRLQRELKQAREAHRELTRQREDEISELAKSTVTRTELESVKSDLDKARDEIYRLKSLLEDKDRSLAQLQNTLSDKEKQLSESQQGLLQARQLLQGTSLVTPSAADAMVGVPMIGPLSKEKSPAADLPTLGRRPVRVYRTNAQHGFVVLSVNEIDSAHKGDILILYMEDEPTAEVQLGDIDSDGMALAYITRMLDKSTEIQSGDRFMARHITQDLGE